jgi:chromosome segregation ATPase
MSEQHIPIDLTDLEQKDEKSIPHTNEQVFIPSESDLLRFRCVINSEPDIEGHYEISLTGIDVKDAINVGKYTLTLRPSTIINESSLKWRILRALLHDIIGSILENIGHNKFNVNKGNISEEVLSNIFILKINSLNQPVDIKNKIQSIYDQFQSIIQKPIEEEEIIVHKLTLAALSSDIDSKVSTLSIAKTNLVTNNQVIQNQLIDHTKTIQQLEEEYKIQELSLQTSLQKVDISTKIIKDDEDKLNSLKIQIQTFEKENSTSLQTINQINQQNNDIDTSINTYNKQINDIIQSEKNITQQSVIDKQRELEVVINETVDLKQQNQILERQIDELKSKQNPNVTHEDLQKELLQLQTKVTEIETIVEDKIRLRQRAEEELKVAQSKNKIIDDIQKLSVTLSSKADSFNAIMAEIETLNNNVTKLTNDDFKLTDVINNHKNKVNSLLNQLVVLKESLKSSEDRHIYLQQQLDECQRDLLIKTKTGQQYEKDYSNAMSLLMDKRSKLAHLESQYKAILAKQVHNASILDEINLHHTSQLSVKDSHQRSLTQLQDYIVQINSQFKAIEETKNKINESKNHIDLSSERAMKLEEEYKNIKSKIDSINNQVNDVNSQLTSAQGVGTIFSILEPCVHKFNLLSKQLKINGALP